jgi:calcineurin-like phosphoesterase
MTGGHDSVIGMKKDESIKHFLTMLPVRFEPSKENPQINAVVVKIDNRTGKAVSITRIDRPSHL